MGIRGRKIARWGRVSIALRSCSQGPPAALRGVLALAGVAAMAAFSACSTAPRGPSARLLGKSLPGQGEFSVLSRELPGRGDWPMITNSGAAFAYPPFKGVVSWYGKEFAGKRTSNGEKYNPGRLTAAHKTLPFNTILRVTYPDSGKSVVVRVNDRGPWIEGRTLDLSREAAQQIGLVGAGFGPCKIEILEYPLVETNGPGGNG